MQVFARKIVRIFGEVTQDDIENEIRVLCLLNENEWHQNIVKILRHGSFDNSPFYYFIDMELCDLNLSVYIDYHSGRLSSAFHPHAETIETIDTQIRSPVFVGKDCSFPVRMHDMWTIASHIASGLEFIHSLRIVHRDLKPCNGISPSYVCNFSPLFFWR